MKRTVLTVEYVSEGRQKKNDVDTGQLEKY